VTFAGPFDTFFVNLGLSAASAPKEFKNLTICIYQKLKFKGCGGNDSKQERFGRLSRSKTAS